MKQNAIAYPHEAAYAWTTSSFIQLMKIACLLFGAKPSSGPYQVSNGVSEE